MSCPLVEQFFIDENDDPFWVDSAKKAGIPIRKSSSSNVKEDLNKKDITNTVFQDDRIKHLEQTVFELETKMKTLIAEKQQLYQYLLQEQNRGNKYKQLYQSATTTKEVTRGFKEK